MYIIQYQTFIDFNLENFLLLKKQLDYVDIKCFYLCFFQLKNTKTNIVIVSHYSASWCINVIQGYQYQLLQFVYSYLNVGIKGINDIKEPLFRLNNSKSKMIHFIVIKIQIQFISVKIDIDYNPISYQIMK